MVIHGKECMFTPMALYLGNKLLPETPNADRGLRWRINRKWVSYKQIKFCIRACPEFQAAHKKAPIEIGAA